MVLKRALICGLMVAATVFAASQARAAQDILFGGGSVTGVYYRVALQACAVINRYAGDKFNCVGRPALGSVFNVNAVKRGLLDFGVVQSDRNHQAWTGTADWKNRKVESLRSVFSVHPEAVLVMTRKDTGIRAIADLRGRRVNIGNPGSGHRGNAEDVLRIHGLDWEKDLQAEGLQQSQASRALIDKKIDAFFYTVGNPSAAIEEPANAVEADLLPVNSAAVRSFIADKPYYVMTTVPSGIYNGIDHDTETFAVKATVVANATLDEALVYEFVKTLFENLEEFKASDPAFEQLTAEDMLKGLTAPLHPGAAKFYKEKGWM